jgi:hypothetical protein
MTKAIGAAGAMIGLLHSDRGNSTAVQSIETIDTFTICWIDQSKPVTLGGPLMEPTDDRDPDRTRLAAHRRRRPGMRHPGQAETALLAAFGL